MDELRYTFVDALIGALLIAVVIAATMYMVELRRTAEQCRDDVVDEVTVEDARRVS